MSEQEKRWLAGGASLRAARALATLEASGASGLGLVNATHTPELPLRSAPREDFMDRDHVEAITEVSFCCPRRFICTQNWKKFEDFYTVFIGGQRRTIFAGMRAAPDKSPEGWLPVVVRAPSAVYTRIVVIWRVILVLPCFILLTMAFMSVSLVGSYVALSNGEENLAGIINPGMCLKEFPTTDDDETFDASGLPPWIDNSLVCYAKNVTVHKLPLWLSNLVQLGLTVNADKGVLKPKAIWPAAVVCSPILAATILPSFVIGIMARVTSNQALWGGLSVSIFALLLGSLLYLNTYFFAQSIAFWPVVLDIRSVAKKDAIINSEAALNADVSSQEQEKLVFRKSLLLLCALQQVLAVHNASLHMVSYCWTFRKGVLLARFLGATLPDCWLDIARLPFSQNLSDQIVAQAQHTRTLMMIVDSSYLRSINCCRELAAAVLHRSGGGENFLTAVVLCNEENVEISTRSKKFPSSIDWDAIESTFTDLGFHIAKGPRTLQEWLLARSLSVSTRKEAQGLLHWYRTYGMPLKIESATTVPFMPTQTMLNRTTACFSFIVLISALCYCRCTLCLRQRARLVAGMRTLSADGKKLGTAWFSGGRLVCQLVFFFFLLLLILTYSLIDFFLGLMDGSLIYNHNMVGGGHLPIFINSYMSLENAISFFVFFVGIYSLFYAFLALWAADPRRRYDKVLHPLIVAAQCDDWMRGIKYTGAKGLTQECTTEQKINFPFFRVVLATEDASASMHGSLSAIIDNIESFLAKDIGVTVTRATVREALAPPLAQAASTVTVFFLSSAQSIEEWLQHSSEAAHHRHVIAVCPCCASQNSGIMQFLFVGVCQSGAGKAEVGLPPSQALDARKEASVPFLVLGEEESSARQVNACTPNPSFAFDLILAISTKVPEVLLAKSEEVEG